MGAAPFEADTEDMTSPRPASAEDLVALRRSGADGTLELLYQPEVELDSGALVAMEGLLHWQHGDLGVLAPPSVLDLAERGGGIGAIGHWVLREGAAEARRWTDLPGGQRRLWLAVGTGQVSSPDLPGVVAGAIAEHGLPEGALGLEVSEATVLELADRARPLLGALHEAGVALAVDEFSTWYATRGVIAELPVDVVKLGQRYVRGVGQRACGAGDLSGVVDSIIGQAHEHGMLVVAEGVQTWTEAARLTELGCDRARGWLFASAQRADQARSLLARGRDWRSAVVTPTTSADQWSPARTPHP